MKLQVACVICDDCHFRVILQNIYTRTFRISSVRGFISSRDTTFGQSRYNDVQFIDYRVDDMSRTYCTKRKKTTIKDRYRQITIRLLDRLQQGIVERFSILLGKSIPEQYSGKCMYMCVCVCGHVQLTAGDICVNTYLMHT